MRSYEPFSELPESDEYGSKTQTIQDIIYWKFLKKSNATFWYACNFF